MIVVVNENCGPDPSNTFFLDTTLLPADSPYLAAIESGLKDGPYITFEINCGEMWSYGNETMKCAVLDGFPTPGIGASVQVYSNE